jgi:integrase
MARPHLAHSGLRRGEIAALRWSDIDLTAGTNVISRNRLRFGDQIVEGTVKSKASQRELPLPDNLAATLNGAGMPFAVTANLAAPAGAAT